MSSNVASIGKKLHDGSKWGMPPEKVYDIAKLGMWLFLATEVILFAVLFTGFAVYYFMYPEAWHESAKALSVKFGAANTVILLTSSFTVAWAIDAVKKGETTKMNVLLIITILLGIFFLVNKFFEYSHEIELGNFMPEKLGTGEPVVKSMFFFTYFIMTGIHGLHIIIGLSLLSWVLYKGLKGDFHPGWYTPVEMSGLYWHLVDVVWIYLFPLLYLVA